MKAAVVFGLAQACVVMAGVAQAEYAASIAPSAAPRVEEPVDERQWVFGATAYVFFVPNSTAYVLPIVTLDRERLHLEARYSYEALRSGSVWIGYNFSGGEKLVWELRPIIGTVFGALNGLAPGYEGSLGVWQVELYSEGEFVFDYAGASDSFFYSWSELSLAPVDGFHCGLVLQRTRVYQTDREVQPGLFAGVSYGPTSLTAYVLNPDESRPVVAISAAVDLEL